MSCKFNRRANTLGQLPQPRQMASEEIAIPALHAHRISTKVIVCVSARDRRESASPQNDEIMDEILKENAEESETSQDTMPSKNSRQRFDSLVRLPYPEWALEES